MVCKSLPQPTSNDLEIRLCHVNDRGEEDTLISLIDIDNGEINKHDK